MQHEQGNSVSYSKQNKTIKPTQQKRGKKIGGKKREGKKKGIDFSSCFSLCWKGNAIL